MHLEESYRYVKIFEGKCAAKSSKRSRKPRHCQDIMPRPLCNSISFALQWLIHGVDSSQCRRFWWRVSITTSCQGQLLKCSSRPSYISLTNKAPIHRCLRGAAQSQNKAFYAMIWNMCPKQVAGAEVVELSARLVHIRPALKSALKIALSLNFQFEQNRA